MESKVVSRKAELEDIPGILSIEQACFEEDSFSEQQFTYLIKHAKGAFYVLVEHDQVVAYVSLLFHSGTRYLRIYSIAVHPEYRGRRLGQCLMERTLQVAQELKAVKVTLEVKESNAPAIALYMKNGFIPLGIKPHYYHDGSDAVYMQRII